MTTYLAQGVYLNLNDMPLGDSFVYGSSHRAWRHSLCQGLSEVDDLHVQPLDLPDPRSFRGLVERVLGIDPLIVAVGQCLQVFRVCEKQFLDTAEIPNKYYYHSDNLGSAVLVTDGSGTKVSSYTYGAWGNIPASSGTDFRPYQYVGDLGYYRHTTTQGTALADLMQLGVRFYDPEIGRFTQRDSITYEEISAYPYCWDQPLMMRDSDGRIPLPPAFPIPTECKGINPTNAGELNCAECAWSLLGGEAGLAVIARMIVDVGGIKLPSGGLTFTNISSMLAKCEQESEAACQGKDTKYSKGRCKGYASGMMGVGAFLDCVTDGMPQANAQMILKTLKGYLKSKIPQLPIYTK